MSVCGTICLNCILRTGSTEKHTAYLYRRAYKKLPKTDSQVLMTIPGRKHEQDVQVYVDPVFLAAIQLAVGNVDMLSTHANDSVQEYLNASSRGARERRPPSV